MSNEIKELSEEQKAIFENKGEYCPHCDDNDFDIDETPEQGGDPKTVKECLSCGAVITLSYTLSHVDINEPTYDQTKFISDDEAFNGYLSNFEGGKAELKEKYQNDSVMWSEDWNCHTDSLCKDDKLSDKQYHHMNALNVFLGLED